MEEDAGQEIKLLLGGVIPERANEMKEYLDTYTPYFARCDDRTGFIAEGGAYGILKFTQRTMHQMWLLGFAANLALHSYSTALTIFRMYGGVLDTKFFKQVPDQDQEEEKYKDIVDSAYELGRVESTSEFHWPRSVPLPENRKPSDIEGSATFDLICMSGAYVFLHEMRHIKFSIDGNAPEDPHEEEHECDLFAKDMMLSNLAEYSEQSGYALNRLKTKRAIAIVLGLFYMLVITPIASWGGTETHPSIKSRIESLVRDLDIHADDILWIYMSSLFLSHLQYVGKGEMSFEFNSMKELALTLVNRIELASNNSLAADARSSSG